MIFVKLAEGPESMNGYFLMFFPDNPPLLGTKSNESKQIQEATKEKKSYVNR